MIKHKIAALTPLCLTLTVSCGGHTPESLAEDLCAKQLECNPATADLENDGHTYDSCVMDTANFLTLVEDSVSGSCKNAFFELYACGIRRATCDENGLEIDTDSCTQETEAMADQCEGETPFL